MILVTVGAQMPFDRLIRAVDAWAAEHPQTPVLAQIGTGAWQPQHMQWTEFIAPDEFRRQAADAQALVAHAGMGTIITALQFGRPLLVMPRRGDLRETRNDHQVATARRFDQMGKVAVAFDEHELPNRLDTLLCSSPADRIDAHASPDLINALRGFILDNQKPITATDSPAQE